MLHIGRLTSDSADQEEEIMDVCGELHEHEQWEPQKLHCVYCSVEPLAEDLYQKGRDDKLRAMQDHGVTHRDTHQRGRGRQTHPWIPHSSHEGRQGEMGVLWPQR